MGSRFDYQVVPVVWVRTHHDRTTDTPAWVARTSMVLAPDPKELPPANCATGTWGAEFYHVQPAPGEPVVTKSKYSAFAGTSFGVVLRTVDRPSLLFTGVSTNTCVESTLRDALFHDFHVVLVEDCCVGSDDVVHAATVENVGKRFGPVVSSDLVMEHWRQQASAA